ncbi:MAG: PAS domain-containing protein, partial [Nocardioides sp.]
MTAALDEESDRVALRLAIDAAGVGAFVWNLVTGRLRWDQRLLELFGLDESTFGGTIEAFNECVHPDDLPRVSDAIGRAIDTCGEFAAEYRVVLPGGGVRWIEARGRAFAEAPDGPVVRLVGAAYDNSDRREAQEALLRSAQRLALLSSVSEGLT